MLLSEGEGSGTEESESEEEVVEGGVTVKRKKKHRRKSKLCWNWGYQWHLKNRLLIWYNGGFLLMSTTTIYLVFPFIMKFGIVPGTIKKKKVTL